MLEKWSYSYCIQNMEEDRVVLNLKDNYKDRPLIRIFLKALLGKHKCIHLNLLNLLKKIKLSFKHPFRLLAL